MLTSLPGDDETEYDYVGHVIGGPNVTLLLVRKTHEEWVIICYMLWFGTYQPFRHSQKKTNI